MQAIMRYELVINEALRSALMFDTPDEQINEFIRFFGKHIGCDRIYIFEDNKKKHVTNNTYEWCSEGIQPEIDFLQGVDMDIIDWWYKAFDKKENVIIQDVETIKKDNAYKYNTLKVQNVTRLVVCPIRYKDEISGFFGVDNPPIDNHSSLTTFLDMIATLVVSFLKIRNSQNKSKQEAKLSGYSALAQIYISMHYINIKTQKYHIVKTEPEILKYLQVDKINDVEDCFSDHIYKIHKEFCQQDYVDREIAFMDLETLDERLQNKKSIDSVFYGKISGWCRGRYIPVDYDEDGHETEESSYNEYGDYVLYRPNSTKEGPIYGLPVNYTVNAFPQDTYIDSINAEFQKFMDEGIKVYFTYSPRNKYALSKESTEEERARLHEYFKSQLHIPVISELEDSLYTGIYLYGTDNHLSTEGAQIRTERVIRDLKEQLAKEEKK